MAGNVSKYTKEQWEKVHIEYDLGNFKNLTELGARFSMNPVDLQNKIWREKWAHQREERAKSLLQKVNEVKESEAEKYLKRAAKRFQKYEEMISVSQANLGSKDANGVPILDPDAIGTYTLAEARVHELIKSALRIPDVKNLDITSKGQSIGESLVSAIAKLREDAGRHVHTEEEKKMILEAEIIDDP